MIDVITFFPTPEKYIDLIAVFLLACYGKIKGHILLRNSDFLPEELENLYKNSNVEIHYIPFFKKVKQKKVLKEKVREIIQKSKNNKLIIHDHFYWITPFSKKDFLKELKVIQSYYTYIIGYFTEIITFKQPIPKFQEIKKRLISLVDEVRTSRKADIIIVQAPNLERYLHFKKNKIKIIPNAVKCKNVIKENIQFPIRIAAVNRWLICKGSSIFIDAIKILMEQKKENLWEINLGGPNADELYKELLKFVCKKKIKFFGANLTKERLKELFINSDIMICPSPFEGSPRIILEAMSFGVSSVAFDLPGIKVLNVNNCLEIVPLREGGRGLAHKVSDLLESSKIISNMDFTNFYNHPIKEKTKLCISVVYNNFSYKQVSKKLHNLYLRSFNKDKC